MKRKYISPIILTVLAAFGLSSCQDDTDLLPGDVPQQYASPLMRAAAEDQMTISDFRRSYGVGFSYDGIYGERGNLRDVRCRVLDLDAIHRWEQESSTHIPLLNAYTDNSSEITTITSYSQSEYLQQTTFEADIEAEMIVFHGEAQANIDVWGEVDANDFLCTVKYRTPSLVMTLGGKDVSSLIQREGRTDLLVKNFRDAIDWLQRHPTDAVIDSFLNVYGSHIVTKSRLGGELTLNMTLNNELITDVYTNKVYGEAAIQGILHSESSSEDYERVQKALDKADCNITIKGGDLSKIPNHLLHFTYEGRSDLTEYVKQWSASLNYNPMDMHNNNMEMTDMEMMPIWKLIPNKTVAKQVQMRVEGTAEQMISTLGYQNFVNTSFQLPQVVTCKMGGQSTTFNQPAVSNVIAAGRYVATICREEIDLPNIGRKQLQVVYPIYDRQVNLRTGFCMYDTLAYKVRWINNNCTVEVDTTHTVPAGSNTVYLTKGAPRGVRAVNTTYQNCAVVIGYEWPLAITQYGTLDSSKPYYLTYKQNGDFLLRNTNGSEQTGSLNGLPNWTYDGSRNRMVRNKKYYYYWNPTELQY